MKSVTIYTDGACSGNPGRGGYGVLLESGRHTLELAQGYTRTTNNRMELLAAIVALEVLKEPCVVELHSDSRYVVDAMSKHWIRGWKAKGWKTSGGGPVKNKDLWLRLCEAMAPHRVSWHWVRGHAGHPKNERCDQLAVAASRKPGLLEDVGFEEKAES